MEICLQVIYWEVSLRVCEGSRMGQKLKFSGNAAVAETLANPMESSVAGQAFRDVPH